MDAEALFERQTEVEQLARATERARDGHGSVAVVAGPPGVGKTALLAAASAAAEAGGLTVLRARGSELERGFAFGAVRQLFSTPIREMGIDERRQALLGAASPAESLLREDGDRSGGLNGEIFPLLHGLHWLTANLTVMGPLLLCVDDAQWVDEPSLRFLAYLAERIEELAALALLTLRTGERDSPELELDAIRRRALVLHPRELTVDGSVSLIRERLGDEAAPQFCTACHRASGGNPLLLGELLRAIEADGLAPTVDASIRVEEIGARGVAERLLSRISRRGEAAVQAARAVATLEPRAGLRAVADTARLDEDSTVEAIDSLIEGGVLRNAEPFGFVHPIMRSAVEADMSEPEQARFHERAAISHRDSAMTAEIVAAHLLRAPLARGSWVIDLLGEAAEQALARGAPSSAVGYLQRALPECGSPEERLRIDVALARAQLRAGDENGIDRLREAVVRLPFPERAAAAAELTQSLMIRGRGADAVPVLEAAIEDLGEGSDFALEMRALLVMTGIGGYEAAFGEPYRALRRAAPTAAAQTIPQRLALQSLAIGDLLAADDVPRARESALAALGSAADTRQAAAAGFPLSQATMLLAACGEVTLAIERFAIASEEARKRGSAFGLGAALVANAAAHLARGDLDGAEVLGAEADPIIAAGPGALGPWLAGVRAAIALERGQPEAARDELVAGDAMREREPVFWTAGSIVSRARVRLATGEPAAGLADIAGAAAAFGGMTLLDPALAPARLQLAAAIAAAGDIDAARERAETEEAWARGTGSPRWLGLALLARGRLVREGSLEALREAVGLLEPTDHRLDHAHALVELGAALRRAGQRKLSRDPLRRGMDFAQRCGATALVERARVELEAAGARPRSTVLSGAESLTPSERRVAELAATGMTNRDIAQQLYVTMKTVETHLRHCYQKLDIPGRGDLAEALAQEGPPWAAAVTPACDPTPPRSAG